MHFIIGVFRPVYLWLAVLRPSQTSHDDSETRHNTYDFDPDGDISWCEILIGAFLQTVNFKKCWGNVHSVPTVNGTYG